MAAKEKEWFTAFRRGIGRIICKHSAGLPQTENVPPGIHQHREILFILRGESRFPLNHKTFDVKAGDVILIDRWIPHRVGYPDSDRNMLYLWFYLFPTHLNLLLHQIDQAGTVSYALKWVELAADLKLVLDRRWDDFDRLSPQTALANLDAFFRLPLTMLLDEFQLYLRLKDLRTEKNQSNNDIVNSIRHIIEAKNGRDCSLAQLEKLTGFNRFYISHLFKDACGISIGEYINRVRIIFFESAKKRGFSHKQIAFELGFSSNSALLMWYRKARERIR